MFCMHMEEQSLLTLGREKKKAKNMKKCYNFPKICDFEWLILFLQMNKHYLIKTAIIWSETVDQTLNNINTVIIMQDLNLKFIQPKWVYKKGYLQKEEGNKCQIV